MPILKNLNKENKMNIKNLLDQLLGSGADLLKNNSQASQGHTRQGSEGYSSEAKQSGSLTDSLSSLISGKGGAALGGGALGLLLGSKSGRKMGGKVLTYGGLAVLGTLAYKAYKNYQQKSPAAAATSMQPLALASVKEAEARCNAILIALIAASKADGHIDDRERQLIHAEVTKLSGDPELQDWVDRELKKPLDPTEVASHATNTPMAAEIYLASLLAVDQQNFMEKSYLDELARQLKLPPALQAELASQAQQATSGGS